MSSRSSQSSASCRVRVVYAARGCGPQALAEALRVAAHSLILSNDIRRDACAEVYLRLGPGCAWHLLRVEGSRARGLGAPETMVEGLARSLLRGDQWPGITLSRAEAPGEPGGCVTLEQLLAGRCSGCVLVRGSRFKPWWEAAAAMVAWDEWCGCRARGEG